MKEYNIKDSKILTLLDLILVIIFTIAMMILHQPLWTLIAPFFAFMMAFSHLVALLFVKLNNTASSKLDYISVIFGFLTILAIIGEFIIFQIN